MTANFSNRVFEQDIDDMDKEEANEAAEAASKGHMPRMSPYAKIRIYKDYKKGMNIRDISLKYGILPERACGIIWMKDYFYKIVYPRVGETTTRLAFDMERRYGELYGFVDYGQDLEALGKHEQGALAINFNRSPIDIKPPKEVKRKIEQMLGGMKTKRIIEVPVGRSGKGPGGYLLKEMIASGGKAAVQPSREVTEGVRLANKRRKFGYE